MKLALVHDWLVAHRGGEKVLESLCNAFPDSDIFTLVCDRANVSPRLVAKEPKVSFIQKLPFALKRFRSYLPLFPLAVESFDLRGYDLVLSTSHCVAKGAIPPRGAMHICYCFTPARYAWCFYNDYFPRIRYGFITRTLISATMHYLRRWDIASCSRVHHFIAPSQAVRGRIYSIYKRDSTVIYPPVNVDYFDVSRDSSDFYLIVSALTPYKRIDLAVSAFNELGRPLKVIGSGPEYGRLAGMAKSNVEFLGGLSDEQVREHYRKCRALIFPGEEEFGIVAAEAQACGKPVVAYGKGGVTEIVMGAPAGPGKRTGLFFDTQNPGALAEAVRNLDTFTFSPDIIRQNALRFSPLRFENEIREYVQKKLRG